MPSRLILLLGGARSGKSALAERLAARLAGAGDVLYVATAQAGDDEMRARIAEHRRRRPASWRTLEAPLDLAASIRQHAAGASVVLVDCLTVWTSNLMLREAGDSETLAPAQESAILTHLADLLAACRSTSATCLLISNEVGLGLVPPYPLGRAYRDLLGRVNQRAAADADEVYLLVAGIPVDLKALASPALLALLAAETADEDPER
jgi:adenosylcobinamide kinase/adenosylcobinamide-phosphate guanylyltransferase